jgi:hypothetical protein
MFPMAVSMESVVSNFSGFEICALVATLELDFISSFATSYLYPWNSFSFDELYFIFIKQNSELFYLTATVVMNCPSC